MNEYNTKPIPGFMELLPEEQIEFDRIKSIILDTYEQFGFTALDTPLIERKKTLLAKGGGETAKQVYSVENKNNVVDPSDNRDSELALRFDLTVPLARYVAEHFNDLSFPFRRCHVSRVYRGEKPQKGRFREFYQCDIDVIGRDQLSIRYDAEIPYIIYQIFKKLDLGKFTIRINNRKLFNGLLRYIDESVDFVEVLRVIDKVEKVSHDDFIFMLKNTGLNETAINTLQKFIQISGSAKDVLQDLKALNIEDELFLTGLEELETVSTLLLEMGVDPNYYTIDLSIVRGLDYYTGTVYETKLDDYQNIGSPCSGGRFDDLASYYTDEKLPGVGISIGLTRLFYQLRENGLINATHKTVAEAIVIPVGDENIKYSIRVSNDLRKKGIKVDTLLESMPFKKKMKYASKKDAMFTIIIGSEEEKSEEVALQYRKTGRFEKVRVSIDNLSDKVDDIRKELMAENEI